MRQGLGTLLSLIIAFIICFVVLTFGLLVPRQVVALDIVNDFLAWTDLEMRIAIAGTVLYPPDLGIQIGAGARGTTLLTWLSWATGGLIAGLVAKGIGPGVFAAIFSVILGAFLVWLLVFVIQGGNIINILGTESMILMQVTLQGSIYPGIAATIGGLLGGGISRER